MNSLPPIFAIAPDQWEKAQVFMKECDAQEKYGGAIGGGFTWTFTGTSLGLITKLYWFKGTADERMFDLSDYESW